MEIQVIGSTSKGNCYVMKSDSGKYLIIEAGVRTASIMDAINHDIKNVEGCIITHEHKDHSLSAGKLKGVNIYASKGTHGEIEGIHSHRRKYVNYGEQQIGEFTIMGFRVKHDAAEPTGYVINHPESGNVLFITDTAYLNYRFEGINSIMIEANYDTVLLAQQTKIPNFVKSRILRTHLSVYDTIKMIGNTDLKSGVILLLHKSESNAPDSFAKLVEEKTGIKTITAVKGLKLEI